VPTDLSPALDGQPDPRGHRNPSCNIRVTLGSLWVFVNDFS
jgi:hypothetical protein